MIAAWGDLLSRKLSRAEFLKYLGVIALSFVGFYAMIRSVNEASNKVRNIDKVASPKGSGTRNRSYGNNSYGG